jgi:hypothetical protein
VEQCRTAVAGFATLDDDVTAATVSALRSEAGRVDLPVETETPSAETKRSL